MASGEKVALVFPGQGTQRAGMGEDFFCAIPASRDVYKEASDILGWDVAHMCFNENDLIDLTEYAQPCIFTTEMAMLRGLQEAYGLTAEVFGGHSVGEYTALAASGAMPFSQALKAVRERGRLMQASFPENAGGMLAIIGHDLSPERIGDEIAHLTVDVANINSTGQVVISGRFDGLDRARQIIARSVTDPQSVRFVPLNVSAPFHSRFMAGIEEDFRAVLVSAKETVHSASAQQVTSNFTGGFHPDDVDAVIDNLVFQISGTVQWRRNMDRLCEKADTIYEIGPHRPLKSFFKSIDVECKSITTLAAAERAFGDQ
ncbi:MAG: ACP S-malonyltransferase [Thermodesulfobacteriota bacterium]|nr:ACP S-malonyltransferase [Thermodesulfobacteriota bacterium]